MAKPKGANHYQSFQERWQSNKKLAFTAILFTLFSLLISFANNTLGLYERVTKLFTITSTYDQASVAVSGYVLSSIWGTPIEGAVVSIPDSSGRFVRTNAEGKIMLKLSRLDILNTKLVIGREGYQDLIIDSALNQGNTENEI